MSAALEAENARLRDALADALDFITGDISGASQRQGILREGFALLAIAAATGTAKTPKVVDVRSIAERPSP